MKCKHEENITYLKLTQIDGKPLYIVRCNECKEYGTIELEEGLNRFGLKLSNIKSLIKESID